MKDIATQDIHHRRDCPADEPSRPERGHEAARAGEHGKGFAVVEAEVRSLPREVRSPPGEINKLSATSVDVPEKAGEMLTRIVPDIQKTAELVSEINAASNEQNTGESRSTRLSAARQGDPAERLLPRKRWHLRREELSSQSEQLDGSCRFSRSEKAKAKSRSREGTAHDIKKGGPCRSACTAGKVKQQQRSRALASTWATAKTNWTKNSRKSKLNPRPGGRREARCDERPTMSVSVHNRYKAVPNVLACRRGLCPGCLPCAEEILEIHDR